jgi:hypothetical protein
LAGLVSASCTTAVTSISALDSARLLTVIV